MKPITLESAIASIQRAVDEKGPDYIYQPIKVKDVAESVCALFDDNGNCSCLVGYVLFDHGYTHEMVISQNLDGIYSIEFARHSAGLSFEITDAALAVLGRLPSMQDNGKTWGECLTFARSYL